MRVASKVRTTAVLDGWPRSAMGICILILACGAAPPKSAVKEASTTEVQHVPLRARPADDPTYLIRPMVMVLEKLALGKAAQSDRAAVLAETGRNLRNVDPRAWTDARNRLSLVKFVLCGGDPDLLKEIKKRNMFSDVEMPLVDGAIAYVDGDRKSAARWLAAVELDALEAVLSGHVAFVLAASVANTAPAVARQHLRFAILQSPGTLVEEAALRLAIQLAIASNDRPEVQQLFSKYLQTFSSSVYLEPLLLTVPEYVVSSGPKPELMWLKNPLNVASAGGRSMVALAIAEAALRKGLLAEAEAAIGLAQVQQSPNERDAPRASLLRAAALAPGANRASIIEVLTKLEAAQLPAFLLELRFALHALLSSIDGPAPDSEAVGASEDLRKASGSKLAALTQSSQTLDRGEIALKSADLALVEGKR